MGMLTKEIDARGMACPQPVLCTKQALESIGTGKIVTIVDNEIARENVVKFAKHQACHVQVEKQADTYYIEISKGMDSLVVADLDKPLATDTYYDTVIVIARDVLGAGAPDLGKVLMKSFLYTLAASDQLPKAVILMNSGVKLTIEGSEVLENFQTLQAKGVELLSCGTCLDYFNAKDRLAVGSVTNMYTILEWMNSAGKVITL